MNIDQLKEMLSKEGFRTEPMPQQNGLKFKFESGSYFVTLDTNINEDEKGLGVDYIRIVFPNFFEYREKYKSQLKVIAHDCTADVKSAKVFVLKDLIVASAEFFIPSETQVTTEVFLVCLGALQQIAKQFSLLAIEAKLNVD